MRLIRRLTLALLWTVLGGTVLARDACHRVPLAAGPEDLALDRDAAPSRLIVSTQPRRGWGAPDNGAIWGVPLLPGGPGVPARFTIEGREAGEPFHPLGIALGTGDGKRLLYVVSRLEDGSHRQIEIFEIGDRTLRRAQPPLRDPLLTSPNDLAVLSGGELYVTNDRARRGLLGWLEWVFGRPSGHVAHYRDGRWHRAAEGIAFPNGIAIDESGNAVFVAATLEQRLLAFRRDPLDPSRLRPTGAIPVSGYPDNLSWEGAGRLTVATHRSLARVALHALTDAFDAPSDSFRVDLVEGSVRRLGPEGLAGHAATTVALAHDGWLYAGQLLGEGLLACRLAAPDQEAGRGGVPARSLPQPAGGQGKR